MKNSDISITFIGAGNAAFSLAKALKKSGYSIHQIINRNKQAGDILATQVDAEYSLIEDFDPHVNVVIVCINDDAIEVVANQLKKGDYLLTHCSGSVSIQVLNQHSNFGVFYPFVSMKKELEVDFLHAPLFLEANEDKNLTLLNTIADSISKEVHVINSEQRAYLHLSAVFAHNFMNHQWSIAQHILEENGMKFDFLIPLLKEHFLKLEKYDPKELQTGPAIRGDEKIISKHLDLLSGQPMYQSIYALITQSIQQK